MIHGRKLQTEIRKSELIASNTIAIPSIFFYLACKTDKSEPK